MTNTPHATPSRIDSLDGLGTDLLSSTARARRDELRPELEAAVRTRGTRRVVVRRVVVRSVAAVVLLTSATTLAVVAGRGTPPAFTPQNPPTALGPSNPAADGNRHTDASAHREGMSRPAPYRPASLVGYVVDDPSVLDRYAAADTPSRVTTLDDGALLDELREAGLPAGLIRTNGRTRLAFHNTRPQPDTPMP